MSSRQEDDRPVDAPRIMRVDAAHVDPVVDEELDGSAELAEQIAGWDPQAGLQQLHQQARELAERLRSQQRRLILRQAELDTREMRLDRQRQDGELHPVRQLYRIDAAASVPYGPPHRRPESDSGHMPSGPSPRGGETGAGEPAAPTVRFEPLRPSSSLSSTPTTSPQVNAPGTSLGAASRGDVGNGPVEQRTGGSAWIEACRASLSQPAASGIDLENPTDYPREVKSSDMFRIDGRSAARRNASPVETAGSELDAVFAELSRLDELSGRIWPEGERAGRAGVPGESQRASAAAIAQASRLPVDGERLQAVERLLGICDRVSRYLEDELNRLS